MKTQILLSSLAILIASLFLGCYKEEDSSSGGDLQNLFFVAFFDSVYQNQQGNNIFTPNVESGGVIMANPIPTFEYWKVGSVTFSNTDYYHYYPGYLIFGGLGGNDYTYIQPVTTNLNPLTVEVSTSVGTLIGVLSLPPAITNLYSNYQDTLPLSQSLNVYWNGNADFYQVYFDYWRSNMDDIEFQEFTSSTSITFSGSIFTTDGELYIYIAPVNGPPPEAGSTPNMVGEGSGFFCYIGYEEEIEIIVGSGFTNTKTSGNPNQYQSIRREKQMQNLLTAYGFNLE
jgi:hypothetical protein